MYCAHGKQPRGARHARRSTLPAACARCGGRAAVIAAAIAGLLAFGTCAVPAVAAEPRFTPIGPVAASGPADLARLVAPAVPGPPTATAPAPARRAAAAPAAAPRAQAAPKPPAPRAAPVPVAPAWAAPAPGAPMTEPFGQPDSGYAAGYHTGTDFAVSVGTPVDAVAAGAVASAGWQASYGNTVVLALPDGHYALYAHLSAIGVYAGQSVAVGQRVGYSGDTGNSTGPHLHFEIRTSDVYGDVVDPLAYLRAHGVTDF